MIKQNIEIEQINNKNEYGIKAKKDFREGDLIFEISNENILTLDSLNTENTQKSTHKLTEFIQNDKMLSIMPNVSLALILLFLQSELNDKFALKWKAYLNILPNEFQTPLFFNMNEIILLKNSQCFSKNLTIHF